MSSASYFTQISALHYSLFVDATMKVLSHQKLFFKIKKYTGQGIGHLRNCPGGQNKHGLSPLCADYC